MNKDLISVVIPIYKVEKYLKKCVESIINQSYKNLEIILVDDGSPDNCGHICDEYSKKDKRIVVIHKENGGLSDARNIGIDHAKGKYITFVDSDDYVELDYIEYLYKLICKYNVNISMCKYRVVYFNNKCAKEDKLSQDSLYEKEKILEDILYGKNFEVSACAKMYLTEQFEKIRYPKGKLFEDNDTTYKLIDQNDYVAVGFESKYNYVIRNESITKKEFTSKHMYLITAVDNMCSYLSKYPSLTKAITRKKFWGRISTLNRMINSSNRNFAREKELRKEILTYKSVLWDIKSSVRDKISILSLIFGLKIYKICWNLYEKMTRRR